MSGRDLVVVIARRGETLDGLHAYLDKLGVPCHGARTLADLGRVPPAEVAAIVLFPDDLSEGDVLAPLSELRRDHPAVRTVVVTRSPERFRAAEIDVVLARPAFGWDIVDAVRGRIPGQE